MPSCRTCGEETGGPLLCKRHRREAIKAIRQEAAETEAFLRGEEDDEE